MAFNDMSVARLSVTVMNEVVLVPTAVRFFNSSVSVLSRSSNTNIELFVVMVRPNVSDAVTFPPVSSSELIAVWLTVVFP